MLLQVMAMARVSWSVTALADPAHAALHWSLQAHQHLEGGAQWVAAVADSVSHLSADASNLSAPPPGGERMPAAPLPHDMPAAHAMQTLAPPFLEGPLRPPRSQD